ncbi:MAG: glycine oxidase ThiO [Actinomycetota bacterium]|nr:glycine oxidase ThiO [Actinomycetota bacterium]
MADRADVVVVGGGIIGCAVAYYVARRGARALVVEAGETAGGASGARAGMLAAQGEAHHPGPLLDLLLEGRAEHHRLADDLLGFTGRDVGYLWAGTLRVATDETSRAELSEEHAWQRGCRLDARWLEEDALRELEPALSPDAVAGLYFPQDGQVNPPQLLEAMQVGIASAGSRVREYTRVTGFLRSGSRVIGVRTTSGDVHAGTVVLAAGVDSDLLASDLDVSLTLSPVKGELVTLRARPAPISANVWDAERLYLVPKRDGRVIVGATEQPDVPDPRPTLGGVSRLGQAAMGLVPGLADALFAETWGGLRPGTPSGEPVLGAVDWLDGFLLATGHFRNGVLLSAVTGSAVGALALGEDPPVDLSPFRYKGRPG